MDLNGRRVVVTGASRGIGEATSRLLAARGAHVVVVARQERALRALADELGGTACVADLSDPLRLDGLIDRLESGGPVDVLVNNAAVDFAGDFLAMRSEELRHIHQLNLLTPMELCRRLIPGMLRRGSGHVVNVSSLAGCATTPGMAAYSTTKAGLTHFTAGLRADLRGLPVRTTVVELGPIPTDMLAHVKRHRPTNDSFNRFYRLKLLTDIDRHVVAEEIVSAIEHDRRHVRLPKRIAPLALLTEAPRRAAELILTSVPARETNVRLG